MIAHVEKSPGVYVDTENGDPECGEDFCDRCGDCLACFGWEPCLGGTGEEIGHHWWVVYLERETPPKP